MNFYKHYIGDFQRDTNHLSLTERGAYLALIHHYYATEVPLPNNLDQLCRIAGAITAAERRAVKVAMGFFEDTESGLMHDRIEAELEKAGERSDTNRKIALAREAKRRAEREAQKGHEPSTNRARNVQPVVAPTKDERSTNQTPDYPEANASGGEADFRTEVFRRWKALPDGGGGAFLGRLIRTHGEDAALNAADRTLEAERADPKAFVQGILRGQRDADDAHDQLMAGVV